MTCGEIKDLLDLYLDNELSEEARTRLERHLLKCPGCAFELRSLEQTRALLLESFPPGEASPSFQERMSARLQDAFSDVLRPEPVVDALQCELPFSRR